MAQRKKRPQPENLDKHAGLLTPEVVRGVATAAAAGLNRRQCAFSAGVSYALFVAWLDRGRHDWEANREPTAFAHLYLEWRAALDKRFAQVADSLYKLGTEGWVERTLKKIPDKTGKEHVVEVLERHVAPSATALEKWIQRVYDPVRFPPDAEPKTGGGKAPASGSLAAQLAAAPAWTDLLISARAGAADEDAHVVEAASPTEAGPAPRGLAAPLRADASAEEPAEEA